MSRTPLTKAVRNLRKTDEEKALVDAGITYNSGSLTKEGRKLAINMVVQSNEGLKSQLVEIAKSLNEGS